MTTEETFAITSVGYSKLVNLGNYENERVNANARVDDGQDADAVLASLKAWVEQRVTDREAEYQRQRDLDNEHYRIEGLKRQGDELMNKAAACRRFLEAHGVKVTDWPDELPF